MKFHTLIAIVSVCILSVGCALFSEVEDGEKTPEEATTVVTDFVEDIIPAGPWKPVAVTIAGIFAGKLFTSKRYRENVGGGFKNLGQLEVREGFRKFAAASGMRHTTEDPEALAQIAETLKLRNEATRKMVV